MTDLIEHLLFVADVHSDEGEGEESSISLMCVRAVGTIWRLAAENEALRVSITPLPVYLLERQENGLSWYIGATTCHGNAWHWTPDVNAATRFSRKEDAAACWSVIARHHVGVGGSGTTETTPTQHIFEESCDAIKSAPTPPAELMLSGEPVAWYRPDDEGFDSHFRDHSTVISSPSNPWTGYKPLYLHPAPDAATVRIADRQAAMERDARRYRALRKQFAPFSMDIDGNHSWCWRGNPSRMKGSTFDAAADRLLEGE